MAVKKSVRLVDNTIALCKIFSGDGPINWSGSINGAANMLGFLVEQGKPELSGGEVLLLESLLGLFDGGSLILDRADLNKMFNEATFITDLKVQAEKEGEQDTFFDDTDIAKLESKLMGFTDTQIMCTGVYLALSAAGFDFDMGQKA